MNGLVKAVLVLGNGIIDYRPLPEPEDYRDRYRRRHAKLIARLQDAGHDPQLREIEVVKVHLGGLEGGGVTTSSLKMKAQLYCAGCGHRHIPWLPRQLRKLSPGKPCKPNRRQSTAQSAWRAKRQRTSDGPELRATDIASRTFRVAFRGYAMEEVDQLLDRITMTLWELEAGRKGELTAQDVDQQSFRLSLRGYADGEVDQLLDEVVETLRHHETQKESVSETHPPVEASDVQHDNIRDLRRDAEEAYDVFLDQVAETVEEFERQVAEVFTLPVSTEPGVIERPEPTEVTSPTQPATTQTPSASPGPTTIEPTPTVTRLFVTRPDETRGRPYTVLLDDKPIGKVSHGATQRFEIPTGMHWVTVKTRKESSNTQVIEPHQGDQITLSCGPASGEIDDLGRKMEGIVLELVG